MFRPFCPVEVQILNPQDAQRAVRALLDKPAQLLVLASRARLAQLGLTPFLTALQGDGHAVQGALDDDVLFGVQSPAQLMAFPGRNVVGGAQAAGFRTVCQTPGRTVIAAGEQALIFHNDGPDLPPQACGAGGNHQTRHNR